MVQVQGKVVVQESAAAAAAAAVAVPGSKDTVLTLTLEQMLSPSCANGRAEQTSSFLTGGSQSSCTVLEAAAPPNPWQPCDWFNMTSRSLVAYL